MNPTPSIDAPSTNTSATTRSRWNLPTRPVDYVACLRGPRRAWWRPLLSLVLLLLLLAVAGLLWTASLFGLGGLGGDTRWAFHQINASPPTPLGLALVDLALALGIPAALLSNALAHRVPAGTIHSVTGRFRWGLCARMLLVLGPAVLATTVLQSVLAASTTPHVHPQWFAYLLVALLLTPLQCAGEEYLFRGWLLQNIGGLFAHRVLAWSVPVMISTATFAVAHGSMDPGVLAVLGAMAVTTTVLTWRTGGLEAAMVLHTLNNVMVMVKGIFFGGLSNGFVGESTRIAWPEVVFSLLCSGLYAGLVLWWCDRSGLRHTGCQPGAESPVLASPPSRSGG